MIKNGLKVMKLKDNYAYALMKLNKWQLYMREESRIHPGRLGTYGL